MNLRQIKENVFNQSKVTIINLENLINDINESTINEDKALQIWEEAVKDSFIQYGRRLLSGLNSNDFTVYQLESFYKLFKEAVIFNDSTSHNIEQLIIKVRKDLGCRLVTLEEDKTINIKTINHIYIETIELFYAKIIKESIMRQYKLNHTVFVYVKTFRFAILEELSRFVRGIIYDENLYFKEKEIVEKLFAVKYETKTLDLETTTHHLESDILAEDTLDYNNEIDFKNTEIGLSFNHISELEQVDLSKVDVFYYEPNYFIPKLDSHEEKIKFYQKLKSIIGEKKVIINLFRLDNINYVYGLTDDVLILDEAVKIMPMVYNEIKVIEECLGNKYAIVIPYTNSQADYTKIKKMLEHCFTLVIPFGVGLEIDNSVIDYSNYRRFGFAIVNLDRVIEECFDKSNDEIDKLEPIEIHTIDNINHITKKKHKNDYIMGTILNKSEVLEQVLDMRYSSIILSVGQYKSVYKKI